MRRSLTAALAIAVALALLGPGCTAFDGADDDGSVPRSVPCGDRACANDEVCCLDGTTSQCRASCGGGEVSLFCDDAKDCASGFVCCITVVVNDDRKSAGLKDATCRRAEDCRESTAPSGPTNLRSCNPSAPMCEGQGCAALTSRYPTVFPSSRVYVCD